MKIEPPRDLIAEAIERASLTLESEPREHFGLSLAGHHCARWLWLSFRWAVISREHSPKGNILTRGQLLRLFARGHREEDFVMAILEGIGCVFASSDTEQFKADFGGHVSGSLDGIILSGVPGAEKSLHIWENKTHGLKSFTDLEKNGVRKSKPLHWAQCQSYMHGTHRRDFQGPRLVKRALYTAVCKDDDRIYTERIHYDAEEAQKIVNRAHEIVSSPVPPEGVSRDPSWYQCKMCDGYDFCHVSEVTREVNCRTCAHSTPEDDGTWTCAQHGGVIPNEWMRDAHPCHAMHPDLVPWDIVKLENEAPVFETEDGLISNSKQLVQLRRKNHD